MWSLWQWLRRDNAPRTWVVSVPVWGERYRRIFLERGLPSILHAFHTAGIRNLQFIIHSDNPSDISIALNKYRRTWLPVPKGANPALQLGNAHRIGLQKAPLGSAVVLCNADMVISPETFQVCRHWFRQGKQLIAVHALRTIDEAPPPRLPAKDLLDWGWEHRHKWVDDCVYGDGYGTGPAVVYFNDEKTKRTAVHCFSLQYLAVHKVNEIDFTEPTADELATCFPPDKIHIVQEPEFALVEACGNLAYGRQQKQLDWNTIVEFAPVYATPAMYWQFRHQILIRGTYQSRAQHIADEVILHTDQHKQPSRLLSFLAAP